MMNKYYLNVYLGFDCWIQIFYKGRIRISFIVLDPEPNELQFLFLFQSCEQDI